MRTVTIGSARAGVLAKYLARVHAAQAALDTEAGLLNVATEAVFAGLDVRGTVGHVDVNAGTITVQED